MGGLHRLPCLLRIDTDVTTADAYPADLRSSEPFRAELCGLVEPKCSPAGRGSDEGHSLLVVIFLRGSLEPGMNSPQDQSDALTGRRGGR
jgi:hypothetical protein